MLPGWVAVYRTGGNLSDFAQPLADASVIVHETSSNDANANRKIDLLILTILFC